MWGMAKIFSIKVFCGISGSGPWQAGCPLLEEAAAFLFCKAAAVRSDSRFIVCLKKYSRTNFKASYKKDTKKIAKADKTNSVTVLATQPFHKIRSQWPAWN